MSEMTMNNTAAVAASRRGAHRASTAQLLAEIAEFCRRAGMAESTFGRKVVNDGKLVARLRFGGRVTTDTVERVRRYMKQSAPVESSAARGATADAAQAACDTDKRAPTHFRFYDNPQKYLLFVNTCNEKAVIADRVTAELAHARPHVPALRLFDAGVGDGAVLTRVLRSAHDRFPTVPFYVVGKELSLEAVRLALDRMPDRFVEHPASVLVMTNMLYPEAPWLRPGTLAGASGIVWKELALQGRTAGQFERQVTDLHAFLEENWTARASEAGNAIYERPVVLVIYRSDYELLLDSVRPKQGAVRADFDIVIASQSYRARAPIEFKAQKVLAPLVRALGDGGRLVGIHSCGRDPGMEIVRRVWPDEDPFRDDRHQLLRATSKALGPQARAFGFNTFADKRALFRYELHRLASESATSIGTSTVMAAWNAAVYVAQIEDARLEQAMANGAHLTATREVLRKHGKLWFQNESYVITRQRKLR